MRTRLGTITIVICLVVAACGRPTSTSVSQVEHQGLVVEFRPGCVDGKIALEGKVSNTTDEPIVIMSGSLPWYHDLMGTEFTAHAAGRALQRNEAAPMIGRPGPRTLAAKESRSGTAPLWEMFPEISAELAAKPVTVRWKYYLSKQANESISGTLDITSDPCVTKE